jgi:hypothetical protein
MYNIPKHFPIINLPLLNFTQFPIPMSDPKRIIVRILKISFVKFEMFTSFIIISQITNVTIRIPICHWDV